MSAVYPIKKAAKVFVFSGPSGSGKTTLAKSVLVSRSLKGRVARSISFTTRLRRSKEKNGKDYFFITKDEFKRLLKAKKILEWTRYLGYYYGTPKSYVDNQLRRGISILLCLDYRGAMRIKRTYRKQAVTIFIMPPSIAELSKRIKRRCEKTDHLEIRRRISLAKQELLRANEYDYRLVNKDLAVAKNKLKAIIVAEIKTPHHS